MWMTSAKMNHRHRVFPRKRFVSHAFVVRRAEWGTILRRSTPESCKTSTRIPLLLPRSWLNLLKIYDRYNVHQDIDNIITSRILPLMVQGGFQLFLVVFLDNYSLSGDSIERGLVGRASCPSSSGTARQQANRKRTQNEKSKMRNINCDLLGRSDILAWN